MEAYQCILSFIGIRHIDKGKPAGRPGLPINDHMSVGHRTILLEQFSQLCFGD